MGVYFKPKIAWNRCGGKKLEFGLQVLSFTEMVHLRPKKSHLSLSFVITSKRKGSNYEKQPTADLIRRGNAGCTYFAFLQLLMSVKEERRCKASLLYGLRVLQLDHNSDNFICCKMDIFKYLTLFFKDCILYLFDRARERKQTGSRRGRSTAPPQQGTPRQVPSQNHLSQRRTLND